MAVQVEIIIRVCPWGLGSGSGFIFFNMRRTGFEVFILFSSVLFESMLSGSAQYSTCCQEHATMKPRLKMQRKRWVSTLVLCGCKWFQAYGVNTELLRNMASKNKNMYRNNQTSWKSAWHKPTRHTKHEHHHQQQSLKHLHPQKTNFMKPLKGFIFGKGNIIVHPAPFPENQRHPEYSGPRSSARRHQVPGIRHAHHGLWVLNQRWRSRSS